MYTLEDKKRSGILKLLVPLDGNAVLDIRMHAAIILKRAGYFQLGYRMDVVHVAHLHSTNG